MRAAGVAALVVAGVACDRPPEPRPEPVAVGAELMTGLLQARALHHLADAHLAEGDLRAAVERLEAILRIRFPVGAPEAEDVLLDARARLANLLAGAGRHDDARRVVDEGIAAASRESYFLANLYAVRGHLLRDAAARADGDRARRLRREAIEALTRSFEMAERVQARIRRRADSEVER